MLVQTKMPSLAASSPSKLLRRLRGATCRAVGVAVSLFSTGCNRPPARISKSTSSPPWLRQQVHFQSVLAAPKIEVGFATNRGKGLDGLRDHPPFEQRSSHGTGQGCGAVWLPGQGRDQEGIQKVELGGFDQALAEVE